jgi:arylsulfatase A-like enzyme
VSPRGVAWRSSSDRGRRGTSSLRTAAALLIAAWPIASCGPVRDDSSQQDIVLVVVDTLRADHLGAYGYERPTSPRIDALAAGGTLFENAWSAAPWTLPSVMSILTGRYPSDHRVENDGLRLGDEVRTLAETMREAGYATAAFVSHIYVSGTFGFARGFERFEDFGVSQPEYRLEEEMEPTADRVTEEALAWLRERRRDPIFLFVHYFDPHWPYAPPAPYDDLFPHAYDGPYDADYDSISKFQDPAIPLPEEYRTFLLARYDGEIRFVDEAVGRLMDGVIASGRADRTWMIVTADHGEEYKDHGSMGHGRQLYEESIRVPLVIGRPAESPRGAAPAPRRKTASLRRESEPASGIDLLPTVLDLAGIAAAGPGRDGVSLAPAVRDRGEGRRAVVDRALVSETIRLNAYRKSVRLGPLKLIHVMDESRDELYELSSDPAERNDLSATRPADRRRLLRALFGEVNLLSGGWNLSWNSDGRSGRFHGEITTDGIFRSVVPLIRESLQYDIQMGSRLRFADVDQTLGGGLSFTTAPADARVTFLLMIDGEMNEERIFLGGQRLNPPQLPFTLGAPTHDAAFARPRRIAERELGYFLWRNRPTEPGQEIVLDDEIRERLRSLGYID